MTTTARASRAKPMPVEERRASIARATLPLLVAHGRDVTTRQIAEAAGVAEGTLFRVFDDKEAIIDAAVEEFLDPEPFRAALRRIDPTLPLELKIELILDRLLDRFSGIFGVFASLGGRPRPPQTAEPDVIIGIFEELLAPDLEALRVPPGDVFRFVRLVAFASAMPHFGPTTGLDADRLANLIVHGIAGDAVARSVPQTPPAEPGAPHTEPGAAHAEPGAADTGKGAAPC